MRPGTIIAARMTPVRIQAMTPEGSVAESHLRRRATSMVLIHYDAGGASPLK